MNPDRLVEAHFNCLKTCYYNWMSQVPFIDTDRPSEEELEKYERDEQAHFAKASNFVFSSYQCSLYHF